MANNKMQIYCKKCLEAITIAKYYPGQWSSQKLNKEKLDNFLIKHSRKCWDKDSLSYEDLVTGKDMFGFRTELDEDGFVTYYDSAQEKLILVEKDRAVLDILINQDKTINKYKKANKKNKIIKKNTK